MPVKISRAKDGNHNGHQRCNLVAANAWLKLRFGAAKGPKIGRIKANF
jgi:hypothetical protein